MIVSQMARINTSSNLALLRWAGAKGWLVPRLRQETIGASRYLEPFLGSGAIFLNLDSHLVCFGGDENRELIEALIEVRDSLEGVLDHLAEFENDSATFYEVRSWDREAGFLERSPSQRAARLIFLNHTCFNGLYRVNSRGYFNVPFGKRKTQLEDLPERITSTSRVLRSRRELAGEENLLMGDYQVMLNMATRGDFFYLDPPYIGDVGKRDFVFYTAAGFHMISAISLLEWMADVRSTGVRAMLSNTASDGYVEKARELGLTVEKKEQRRQIGASNSSRGDVTELIIQNY